MARYKCLTDLFLPAPDCRYAQAGDILSDSGDAGAIPIPVGWSPPTHAVDPLTSDAISNYWQVGPKGQTDASVWQATFTNSARWSGVPVFPPSVYWVRARTFPEQGFVLTGVGASLGVHPPV
jgi:hypothetical protein